MTTSSLDHAASLLRSVLPLAPEFGDRVMELLAQPGVPEQLGAMVLDNPQYAGWLLHTIDFKYPAVKAPLSAVLTTKSAVRRLRSASVSYESRVKARAALAVQAKWLRAAGADDDANAGAHDLLELFVLGYHLGGRLHLTDLSAVLALTTKSDAATTQIATEALAATGRSRAWLDRELHLTRLGPLVNALHGIWWGSFELALIAPFFGSAFRCRVADESAILAMMRPSSQDVLDALRLLGLLATVDGHDAARIVLAGSAWLADLPVEMPDEMFPDVRIQLWAGLRVLNDVAVQQPSLPRGGARMALDDWERVETSPDRPDQEVVKTEMTRWLAALVD